MNDYRINTNYAKALLLMAEERGAADRVADDMRLVEQLSRENRQLAVLFANPTVPQGKKSDVLKALLAEHVTAETMAFLHFVVKKNRAVNLRGISSSYLAQWREARGIVRADLVTNLPVDDEARNTVKSMVAAHTGKQVELHDRTDAEMLGGFELEFDHNMYDARLRTKIRKLRLEFAKNDYEKKL